MSINPEIVHYVETTILPQYNCFDKAHQIGHGQTVIKNSLAIAKGYEVDVNKVYIIAAYHDLGLINGRKGHEKASAAILLQDEHLKKWFSADELLLMAQAAEDHRASSTREPRTIYGKIVSEGDRDIRYETILRRTIEYGLKNYPDYSMDLQYTRCLDHITHKYGRGGYIKLWLNTEQNQQNLEMIRNKLDQPLLFKKDFERIYLTCKAADE